MNCPQCLFSLNIIPSVNLAGGGESHFVVGFWITDEESLLLFLLNGNMDNDKRKRLDVFQNSLGLGSK